MRGRTWIFRAVLFAFLLLAAIPASASAEISMSDAELLLSEGETFQLGLNGLTGMEQSVEWRVKKEKVAEVSPSGEVTAKHKGVTNVLAIVDGVKYRCRLQVVRPVREIRLSKTSLDMVKGEKIWLSAKAIPQKANNTNIVWKSSDETIAKVGAKGKVAAKSPGTATITACAADGSGAEASCTVTVRFKPVTLNMTQLTLKVGEKAKLKATKGFHYGWGSSNSRIVSVSQKGKVKGVSEGNAVIVAKRVEDGQSALCYVKVLPSDEMSSETPPDGVSVRAMQFLKLMEKYEAKLQADKAAGIRWVYGGDCAHTWADVLAQSKRGTVRASCVQPAAWGLRELGIIGDGTFRGDQGGGFTITDREQLDKYCKIIYGYKTADELIKNGTLLPGDICSYVNMRHTNVYAGDGKFYDTGRMSSLNGSYVGDEYVFSTMGPIAENNLIGSIVRIVR